MNRLFREKTWNKNDGLQWAEISAVRCTLLDDGHISERFLTVNLIHAQPKTNWSEQIYAEELCPWAREQKSHSLWKNDALEEEERIKSFILMGAIDERWIGAEGWEWKVLGNSQAVNYNATIATLPLPLVHLDKQSEKGLSGVWDITVGWPAQELEVTHHQVTLLQLQNPRAKDKKRWLNTTELTLVKSNLWIHNRAPLFPLSLL